MGAGRGGRMDDDECAGSLDAVPCPYRTNNNQNNEFGATASTRNTSKILVIYVSRFSVQSS